MAPTSIRTERAVYRLFGHGSPPPAAVESSAFFIRDEKTEAEIIVFGDVEPDSVSVWPRNKGIWEAAAPRVAARKIRAIFIECSYSNDTRDIALYGHLCPRHLAAELTVLAKMVADMRGIQYSGSLRRGRREASDASGLPPTSKCSNADSSNMVDIMSLGPEAIHHEATITEDIPFSEKPLNGFHVYVIHIKDDMADNSNPGEKILRDLEDLEKVFGLGCNFYIPTRGESIWV